MDRLQTGCVLGCGFEISPRCNSATVAVPLRFPNPVPPVPGLHGRARSISTVCVRPFPSQPVCSLFPRKRQLARMLRLSYGSTAYIPLPRRAQTPTSLSRPQRTFRTLLTIAQQRQSPTHHPSGDQTTTTTTTTTALSLQPGGTTQCNAYAAHCNLPYRCHVCATWVWQYSAAILGEGVGPSGRLGDEWRRGFG